MPSARSYKLPSRLAEYPRETPAEIEKTLKRLWPLLRSLTGEGARQTHDILGELVPLERMEIPSGTQCFDWTVPKEWKVREAYLLAPSGKRILDVSDNNLHLLNYSIPYQGTVSLEELQAHLHSLPDRPDAIPYVTSYYEPRWGFCLSHRQRESLHAGAYRVVIDTEHFDGSMTLSEAVLRGETTDEVLISTYTCHPSMANNELSGPIVSAYLYRRLASVPRRRLTYRFAFLPETIGSIAYLSLRGEHFKQCLKAGYVLSCIGDRAPFTYKRSRRGDTLADRAAMHVLSRYSETPPRRRDFSPFGSDERQYCSPGFDLPVGAVARSIYGEYPQYHTSDDNLSFVDSEALSGSVDACFNLCMTLDRNVVIRRTNPYCEPQLGRRNLYPTLGTSSLPEYAMAAQWLLNLADGEHDSLRIAEKSSLDYWLLDEVAQRCIDANLVTSH